MSVTSFSLNPYNSHGTRIGACITAASNIYFSPLSWTAFGASLLGGQLLAHGSIFLGNFCSKCVRSVFSCSKLNKGLEQWCNEKVGDPEYIYRIEAAQKIKEGYTKKAIELDLSNNRLTSLPDVIGSLKNLTCLYLYNNRLTSLPDTIGALQNLQRLLIHNNQLTSLPDTIGALISLTELVLHNNRLTSLPNTMGALQNLQNLVLTSNSIDALPLEIIALPQDCRINVNACPLSATVLTRIRNATETPGYNGPRFYYSIQERDGQIAERPLDELLAELYTICHKTKPDLDQLSEVSNLRAWLGRLSLIADFRSERKTLTRKVTEYLELANRDPVFREYFAQIIEDAATTCGDRMALSVIHLGLAKRLATKDSQNIRELADLLIEGSWTVEQLEKYAREKVETQLFVDEIEVYLGYLIPQTDSFTPKQKKTIRSLKEQLNIPLDVEEMIYFQCSNLSFDELKNGYTTILEKRRSPHERNKFLVSNLYWREALQKIKPSQYDEAMKCDNPLDALDQITNLVMSSESDDQSKEQNI